MNFIFHFIYGMSSFPLTNSYVSRWLLHHQPDIVFFLLTIGSGVIANEPLRELLELLDYRIELLHSAGDSEYKFKNIGVQQTEFQLYGSRMNSSHSVFSQRFSAFPWSRGGLVDGQVLSAVLRLFFPRKPRRQLSKKQ